jgi:hypothetical protein
MPTMQGAVRILSAISQECWVDSRAYGPCGYLSASERSVIGQIAGQPAHFPNAISGSMRQRRRLGRVIHMVLSEPATLADRPTAHWW